MLKNNDKCRNIFRHANFPPQFWKKVTRLRNHVFYDNLRIMEIRTKNNMYKWQCVFRIKTRSETLRACRDCFWGNVPRRRLSFCRRSGRCGRTISPVGIRSIRRRILRLSQYSVTSTVIVRIVWVPVELRADHRRQSQKDLTRKKNLQLENLQLEKLKEEKEVKIKKKNYQRFHEHFCFVRFFLNVAKY